MKGVKLLLTLLSFVRLHMTSPIVEAFQQPYFPRGTMSLYPPTRFPRSKLVPVSSNSAWAGCKEIASRPARSEVTDVWGTNENLECDNDRGERMVQHGNPNSQQQEQQQQPQTENNTKMPRKSKVFPRRRKCETRTLVVAKYAKVAMFLLLRRIALGSTAALASSSPTTGSFTLGNYRLTGSDKLRNAITCLQRLLHRPGTLRKIALAGATLFTVLTLFENLAARRRQAMDPTSEWGRYADRPAARGMALTALLLRLVPFVLLPKWIERFLAWRSAPREENEDNDKSLAAHRLRAKGGDMFANGLLRLGPLYIKIGQILSCRENLFPSEWIVAMEQLQDRVPAKSGRDAIQLAYEACPGGKTRFHQLFTEFDDVPLAAASLGQVHRAKLRSNNAAVAIKIQRSRLRDIYDKDLALMNTIAKVVDKFGGSAGNVGGVQQSWTQIFKDAETILYKEIDYRDEAKNAARFANDFGLGLGGTKAKVVTARGVDGRPLPSASDWLRTPYTYEELSSEKLLVMEYVPSIKVSNNEKLNKAGVTTKDREYLAESLARAYLRQFCSHKFFSTDPHPGNLGVEVFNYDNDQNKLRQRRRQPRLVFYDFGQACSLSDEQAGGILDVIESIIDTDAKKSVLAFDRMGVLVDDADLDKVQAKVQRNYDTGKIRVNAKKNNSNSLSYNRYANDDGVPTPSQFYRNKFHSVSSLNDPTLTNDDIDTTTITQTNLSSSSSPSDNDDGEDPEVMKYFVLQSEYAFVARALSQMDGVGKSLDPNFDFISSAAPHLLEVKGANRYLLDEVKKWFSWLGGPPN